MWKMPKPELPGLVREAIRLGYRHLDCACDYGNEPEVGAGLSAALRDGLCRRDELWVTSKLWNTYHEPKHVRAACERSLRDLKLDVLDLYLVHFPIALAYVPFEVRYPPEWFHDPKAAEPAMKPIAVPYADTWGAMEELQRAGLVKRIGVCNLNISALRDVLASCSIRPAVHQIELHPYLTQPRQLRYCAQENIAVSAFSPLGAVVFTARHGDARGKRPRRSRAHAHRYGPRPHARADRAPLGRATRLRRHSENGVTRAARGKSRAL
jgi:D-xylose reductase